MGRSSTRDHKPIRSLLYAGAGAAVDLEEALDSGADALFIDLESPHAPFTESEVEKRRSAVRELIDEAAGRDGLPRLLVRVHTLDSGLMLGDLRAVLAPGLAGVLLPEVYGAREVQDLAAILTALEADLGLPIGGTSLTPVLETAEAFADVRAIAAASERVNYMGPLMGSFGDCPNSLGYRMTDSGDELASIMFRSLVEARAGGVTHPIGIFLTPDYLANAQGPRRGMRRVREWGYEGTFVMTLDQVELAHEVFSPTQEEIAYWTKLLELYDTAEAAGEPLMVPEDLLAGAAGPGATTPQGFIRPYAVDAARAGLGRARSLGLTAEGGRV